MEASFCGPNEGMHYTQSSYEKIGTDLLWAIATYDSICKGDSHATFISAFEQLLVPQEDDDGDESDTTSGSDSNFDETELGRLLPKE
jgi:hypothetical protein